jgi:hypothetical protein
MERGRRLSLGLGSEVRDHDGGDKSVSFGLVPLSLRDIDVV